MMEALAQHSQSETCHDLGGSDEANAAKRPKSSKSQNRPLNKSKDKSIENYGSNDEFSDGDFDSDFHSLLHSIDWTDPDIGDMFGISDIAPDNESLAALTNELVANCPNTTEEESLLPNSLFHFDWQPLPRPSTPWQKRREPFTATKGPVTPRLTPYDAFVAIWDREVMELIALETNRYAEQTLKKRKRRGTLTAHSDILKYTQTNVDEMYVFLALTLATGIVYKADISEYWSVNNDVFDTVNFGAYMSRNRYHALAMMLHFTNNEIDISHLPAAEAKLHKITPIVRHLNARFAENYSLGQYIVLDEALADWKGFYSFHHFIGSRSRRIKTYELCDAISGYVWRFQVQAGHGNLGSEKEYERLTSHVLKQIEGLEFNGHTLFMDHYFNSPVLARLLKIRGLDCVGALRPSRQHVHPQIATASKHNMPPGGVIGFTSGDVDLLAWKDKSVLRYISTYHGMQSVNRDGKTIPTLVHDYNIRMTSIEKKDQMLSLFPIERQSTPIWYKKFFRRLLNVSVLNAYILYKESTRKDNKSLQRHRQFRKLLICAILERHANKRVLAPVSAPISMKFPPELLEHFPAENPYVRMKKQRQKRSCIVCRKRTTVHCPGCSIPLCLGRCFKDRHSC